MPSFLNGMVSSFVGALLFPARIKNPEQDKWTFTRFKEVFLL
jgi:hypothetical protein